MVSLRPAVGTVLASSTFAAAFPSAMARREKVFGAGSHFCGGSLANDRTVFTAALCVADGVASDVSVHAATIYTTSGGITVDAAKLVVHPNYNPETSNSDIAVVKLAELIAAEGGISYVTLPDADYDLSNGTRVKAAGWGAIDYKGTIFSETLNMVELPSTTRSTCKQLWGGGVDDTMVCAAEPLGGRDVCIGDSGGPLIVVGSSLLVGTVSYGNPCALPNYPTVYASVAHLRDFIDENL